MSENTNGMVKEEMPETEVVAKAKRKRFTAAEKLRILREVDACQGRCMANCVLQRPLCKLSHNVMSVKPPNSLPLF